MTPTVDRPPSPSAERPIDGIDPPLLRGVEDRFVLLVLDRTHVLVATHVMYAVHSRAPFCGRATLPTPIMASRVTNAANASSLICSLPAGRSGMTR